MTKSLNGTLGAKYRVFATAHILPFRFNPIDGKPEIYCGQAENGRIKTGLISHLGGTLEKDENPFGKTSKAGGVRAGLVREIRQELRPYRNVEDILNWDVRLSYGQPFIEPDVNHDGGAVVRMVFLGQLEFPKGVTELPTSSHAFKRLRYWPVAELLRSPGDKVHAPLQRALLHFRELGFPTKKPRAFVDNKFILDHRGLLEEARRMAATRYAKVGNVATEPPDMALAANA